MTPLPEEKREAMIVLFRDWLIQKFDNILKSKEISDTFYLTAKKIQSETIKNQKTFALIASGHLVNQLEETGLILKLEEIDEKITKKLWDKALKYAYENI